MKVRDNNLKDMKDTSEWRQNKIKCVDGEVFGTLFDEEKAVKYGEFEEHKNPNDNWVFHFENYDYSRVYSADFSDALTEVVKDIANDDYDRTFKLRSRTCPKDKKLNRNFYDEEDVADYICYKLDWTTDELYEFLFGIDPWEIYNARCSDIDMSGTYCLDYEDVCDGIIEDTNEELLDDVFQYLSECSFNVLGELIRKIYPDMHVCFWTEYGWSPCLEG